jgi:aspartyl-tRNA(Asn)/glutamyl-tRNA(Gln) amidotransferase subunit A
LKPLFSSLSEIQRELAAGTTSCRQLVEYYLDNIAQRNAELNVFLEVWADEAREQAALVDAKLADGTAGRLAGMVIGLKDVLAYQGHSLQSSSRILDGFKSLFTGTAVARLLAEDAIFIGRQNCDEFAMGGSNENSAFGPVRNAQDPSRVPGGSSGGSAVAVQADMCLASIGSDTGGSVRQPAAFCGVIGLKPTYSRISRLLEVIAGPDGMDSTASQQPVPPYSALLEPASHYRIGYIKEAIDRPGLQPEVHDALENTLATLRNQGHVVEAVDFPYLDQMIPTYYILTTAEASSNLSRFDGVKYGYRAPDATDLESLYKKTRAQGFGPEVQRRIMLGTFVLSASYYDAYYTKAQRVRRLIKDKTDELLRQYDFLILPTTPTTAFKLGEKQDPVSMYLADIFTVQASLSGVPAISIPAGQDAEGMPIGLQIMSGAFREADLLAFANELTAVTAVAE